MKKIFILFTITFIVVNVNAQWFLGGEIGFHLQSVNSKINDQGQIDETLIPKRTEIGFVIAPKCGYYFNEKLALGLNLYVGAIFKGAYAFKEQISFVNWSVYPFVRYTPFKYKKFFLALEGETGIGSAYTFLKSERYKRENFYYLSDRSF